MSETDSSLALGTAMYVLGAALVNTVLGPVKENAQWFHPSIELALFSLGVMALSALYYGRVPYLVMLIAGAVLGSYFAQKPYYVAAAIVPLLYAMRIGSDMGHNAYQDMKGKFNFFDLKGKYAAHAVWIVALSIAVGYFFGTAEISQYLPGITGIVPDMNFDSFLNSLALQ